MELRQLPRVTRLFVYFKGEKSQGPYGDRINAVLAAAGYNFGLLLRWLLAKLLRTLFSGARRTIVECSLGLKTGDQPFFTRARADRGLTMPPSLSGTAPSTGRRSMIDRRTIRCRPAIQAMPRAEIESGRNAAPVTVKDCGRLEGGRKFSAGSQICVIPSCGGGGLGRDQRERCRKSASWRAQEQSARRSGR